MNAWVLLLLPTALGVDFGWERQPDNSIEYIVQIEPEAVDQMKTGTELISALPPQLKNIRNYRIRVGRDRLPNQNVLPPEVANAPASPNIATPWTGGTSSYPPTTSTGTGYPPSTNGGGFANTSLPQRPGTTFPTPTPSGTNPQYYAGTPTSGTSTSGFPMQNATNPQYPNTTTGTGYTAPGYTASGYPTNPAGTTTYPPNTTTAGWNPNGQPSGQPNYSPAGYNPAPNYNAPAGYNNAPGYGAPNNYQPGYQNQPYQNYGPQYMAANPNTAPPLLPDPNGNYYNNANNQWQGMQTAKPSIDLNAGGSPNNQLPGYGNPQYAGSAQGGIPAGNGSFANNGQNGNGMNNAGVNPTDPRITNTAADQQTGTGKTTAPPESQWASLSFALIGLFASLGANMYFGWTTMQLRERYRMMLSDRVTY
ncbi:MAG: hypothetical protein QM775_19360 [Pirellulales bacterium]